RQIGHTWLSNRPRIISDFVNSKRASWMHCTSRMSLVPFATSIFLQISVRVQISIVARAWRHDGRRGLKVHLLAREVGDNSTHPMFDTTSPDICGMGEGGRLVAVAASGAVPRSQQEVQLP